MSDGGGVERLGIAPPARTALRREVEREEIRAALLGEGPAEHIGNALQLLGGFSYLMRRDMDAQERDLLKAIERRLGLALDQLRGRAGPLPTSAQARKAGAS